MAIEWKTYSGTLDFGVETISINKDTVVFNVRFKVAGPFNLLANGYKFQFNFNGTNLTSNKGVSWSVPSNVISTSTESGLVGNVTFTGVPKGTYTVTATFLNETGYNHEYPLGTPIGGITVSMQVVVPGADPAPTTYGNCTAPTTITINNQSSSFIVQSTSAIIIRWSGAGAGTNNPITGYYIYGKKDSAPTLSSYDFKSSKLSSSTASYTLEAEEKEKGTHWYYKIQTIGTASGHDSSISSIVRDYIVNKPPEPPTLNQNSQTIKSTNTTFTVKVTAGAANTGWSERKVYWTETNTFSTSNPLTLTNYVGSKLINPDQGTSKTYYFWTYDGYEHSTSKSITITKNNAPTMTVTFTPSSASTNISTVSIKITPNKPVSWKWELYSGGSSIASTSSTSNISSQTTILSNYNVLSPLGKIYNNKKLTFYFKVIITDSVGETATATSPTHNISAPPTVQYTFDKYNENSNLVDDIHCYNAMRILFLQDGVTNTATATCKIGSANITLESKVNTTTTYNGTTYRVLGFTWAGGNYTNNADTTITITLKDANGYLSKTFTASRKQLPIPDLGTFNMTRRSFDIYNPTTSNINLTCTAPCNFNSNNNPISAASFYISSMVVQKSANKTFSSTTNVTISSAAKEGETLTVSLTQANLVTMGDFNKSTYNGSSTGYIRIRFTNVYGRNIDTSTISYTINYNRNPVINSVTLRYATSQSGTYTNLGTNYIQETLWICARISYTGYTQDTWTLKLTSNLGGTITEFGSESLSISKQTSTSGITDTYDLISNIAIPEINLSDDTTWTVNIISSNPNVTVSKSVTSIKVISHVAPTVKLNKITGVETPDTGTRTGANFTVTGSVSEYSNITNTTTTTKPYTTRTYSLVTGNNYAATSANFTETSVRTVTDKIVADTGSNKATWEQKSVYLKCVTTVVGLTTTTKTGYSVVKTAYIKQPLIAYRSQQLGINTKTPSSGTCLDIRPASEKELIYLGTPTGNRICIDLINMYIDII